MRRFVILIALGCGELAPNPPAPNDYVVTYPDGRLAIQIWHSNGTPTSAAEEAFGDACFTHDGAMLFGETGPTVMGDGPPQLVIVRRGDAFEIAPVPSFARWAVRGDGARLSWVGWQDGTLRTYDRASSALGAIVAHDVASRALYAGDGVTLVLVRAFAADHVELVTMRDDGGDEDIIARAPSPAWFSDPSFSWDDRRVVFVRNHDIVIADRASHVLSTIATIDKGVWDPFLTPDGTAIIFWSQIGDWYSIMRLDIATNAVDVLAKNVLPPNEGDLPSIHISVAPDAL
jgi:hypothetical protein